MLDVIDVVLIPVEVAPEVLAVNSDFDEGRIDPATGYAIPDCDDMPGVDTKTGSGNTKLELGAERNHLDGKFIQGQHVMDDMHKGWFGVNPNQLDDDFWDGGNVTIRKIDKIDDETGYKVSGQQNPTIRRRLFGRRMLALWKPTSTKPPASSSNPIKPDAPVTLPNTSARFSPLLNPAA